MKVLVLVSVLLIGLLAKAHEIDYDFTRGWVEKHCSTNAIPPKEQMFVCYFGEPTFSQIIRFHKSISLKEIVNKASLSGKTVYVKVMRTESLKSGHYTTRCDVKVGPADNPSYELKRLDAIWIRDEEVIITR